MINSLGRSKCTFYIFPNFDAISRSFLPVPLRNSCREQLFTFFFVWELFLFSFPLKDSPSFLVVFLYYINFLWGSLSIKKGRKKQHFFSFKFRTNMYLYLQDELKFYVTQVIYVQVVALNKTKTYLHESNCF